MPASPKVREDKWVEVEAKMPGYDGPNPVQLRPGASDDDVLITFGAGVDREVDRAALRSGLDALEEAEL